MVKKVSNRWGLKSTEQIYSYLKNDLFISSIVRTHRSGNQEREMGELSLIHLPNHSFTKLLVSIFTTLKSADLEVLIANGGIFLPRGPTIVELEAE